jgi:hypothetical protein
MPCVVVSQQDLAQMPSSPSLNTWTKGLRAAQGQGYLPRSGLPQDASWDLRCAAQCLEESCRFGVSRVLFQS